MSAGNNKLIRVMNGVAAGTSDQTSSAIDTAGFDGVTIYTAFGTITSGAVTSVKVQSSSDNGSDTYADLLGTAITVADTDSNKCTVHTITRPRERYLKVVIDRGTQNAVIDGIFATLYGPSKLPTAVDTTVIGREIHVSPAEGTA